MGDEGELRTQAARGDADDSYIDSVGGGAAHDAGHGHGFGAHAGWISTLGRALATVSLKRKMRVRKASSCLAERDADGLGEISFLLFRDSSPARSWTVLRKAVERSAATSR